MSEGAALMARWREHGLANARAQGIPTGDEPKTMTEDTNAPDGAASDSSATAAGTSGDDHAPTQDERHAQVAREALGQLWGDQAEARIDGLKTVLERSLSEDEFARFTHARLHDGTSVANDLAALDLMTDPAFGSDNLNAFAKLAISEPSVGHVVEGIISRLEERERYTRTADGQRLLGKLYKMREHDNG